MGGFLAVRRAGNRYRGSVSPAAVVPVERPADLSAEWLTETLGSRRVNRFTAERIGTGQVSECYRVTLGYDDGGGSENAGPSSVVLKVAASDPTSRQSGQALGLYEREVRFYADVAPLFTDTSQRGGGPIAHCYHSSYAPDTGMFTLLLDDAAPAEAGDEIRGATIADATLALNQLGRLHAPLIGGDAPVGWLVRETPVNQGLITALYAGFTDRYGEAISDDQRMVCQRLVDGFDAYLAEEAAAARTQGLVHGDYRLDNMLFGRPGSPRDLTVVDWQTVTWGPAMTDVAYFLGCALTTPDRRAHYDDLLAAYRDGLGAHSLNLEEIRDGVRRQSFFGVMMSIVSSMVVVRTDRGDEMFMTMLERHSSHVLDTGALEVLPA